MPTDRAETLRNAEQLLRQGKLDAAIAEYLRVLEEQPSDWATANTLGDLYVRCGHTDKAVEQFRAIADSLSGQGFFPKAAAVYKKILKLVPDDEHALLQSAEIAARQGLYADARNYLTTVIEQRGARGDDRGAAEVKIRLGNLDPSDHEARLTAAVARVDVGDTFGAIRELQEISDELLDKRRPKDAIQPLREAVKLAPEDEALRARLLEVYIAAEDFTGAREYATTIEQLQALADALDLRGRHEEALEILRDAEWIDPHSSEMKAHLARALLQRGDVASAGEFLSVEAAGDDPKLLLTVAEIQLQAGRPQECLAIVRRVLAEHPRSSEQVAAIASHAAERSPDTGFALLEAALESMVVRHEWEPAAAALQEFVNHAPSHIAALMRLVEVCVDGGLETAMYSAQARLVDAYLAAGMGSEARTIAEDLVAREPWERANIERFRAALVLLGERDPDAIIADRLSGDTPFTATDLPAAPSRARAIDVEQVVEEPEPAPPAGPSSVTHPEQVEVDLTVVLDDITVDEQLPPAAPEPVVELTQPDIDDVFAQFRDEASKHSDVDAAQQDYIKGLALRDAGDLNGCMASLKSAARSPRLQFAAESMLGRLCKEQNLMPEALEWFERAAEAEAPSPEDYHALLLELADTLEAAEETARALAVCLELQSDAGAYRDVAERIDRLSKVQARG